MNIFTSFFDDFKDNEEDRCIDELLRSAGFIL